MRTLILAVVYLFIFFFANAQLQPGFDKDEYKALLAVTAQFSNDSSAMRLHAPDGYKMLYRSPVMGLDNCWDLWATNNGIPIISIRGTTGREISWMENFYAAMVPATGELTLSSTQKFLYHLAESPKAAVHTGWLIGMASLSKDMLNKIDSCYKKGNKDFYIVGHSQGGAIAYLFTAYLHGLQQQNLLPADIRFKTYCSAAPKPGNLYFAYDYESYTQLGWAYNVVNAADWVPETPFSVQTVDDFTTVNPFTHIQPILKKTRWPKKWILKCVYRKLTRPAKKARKNYIKYLGNYVAKTIQKALPGFMPPKYFNGSDYVRTGNIISLVPKKDYYERFPEDNKLIFRNHLPAAYLYLTDQLK
jgi:hypothetical protein